MKFIELLSLSLLVVTVSPLSAQTLKPVSALDPAVCDYLGCTAASVQRLDRDFIQQEFGENLFGMTWATASDCLKVSPATADCENSVAVATDAHWHRIVWTRASEFVVAYGARGKPEDGSGHFHSPRGVDISHSAGDDHVVFVADALNDRIVVLGLDEFPFASIDWIGTITGTESGTPLSRPHDVAWDHAGTWSRDDDRLFIADTYNSRILVYEVDVDPSAGTMSTQFLDSFGSHGSGASSVAFPQGIAVRSVGQGSSRVTNIYVADTQNQRVSHWKYDGLSPSPLHAGVSSPLAGAGLVGIDIDSYGDPVATDRSGNVLHKLSGTNLNVLESFGGTPSWQTGNFSKPTGVDVHRHLTQSGSAIVETAIPFLSVTERWSDSTGGQVQRLGTRAKELFHSGSCGGSLNFNLTGATDRYRVTVTGSGGTRVFPLQYNPPLGYYPSGSYSTSWDGANTQGNPMPSGQYILKVYTESPYPYDNNAGITANQSFTYNCNFYINASVPSNVTQKAWYPLNGSATHSATDWEWQTRTDSASWSFWADEQNTGWVAYAGEYVKDWKLSAESTQGGGTNFDIETTYVCTTGSCGGGPPPMEVVASDIGDQQPTSGQATPVAIASGSSLRSVSESTDPIHFGSGIWVGREHAGTAYVDRYYSLLGQHDVNLGEEEWPNLLEADSVDWSTAARADGLSHRVSSRRVQWKDGISIYAIAGEIDAQKGGSSPISFALAADPDLGEPHDDELGFDESRELVWVGDVDSTFVGYVVLDAPRGANVAVVQYGLGLDDEPTRRARAHQELTKESSWAQGVKGDVRFLLTVDRVDVDEHGRFDINLAVLRANSLAELTGLVDELRSSTGAVLASMAPPEVSDDPTPRALVPDEFALSQRLPGLQAVVQTGNLVRREAPMAHSVIGGQSNQGGASSAAVAQAIRVSGVTALNFDVPEASRVIIRVYDRTGAMVRTLLDEDVDAGAYAYGWDGRADTGQRMSPGVYYAVMEAEGFSDRSKLILVR